MRGEGSLMALLGRDVTKRKRKPPSAAGSAASSAAPDPPSASGQRSGQGSAQGHSPATRHGAGARPNRTAAVHPAIAAGTPFGKPLPAGLLCCPVCNCQLSNEESATSHIDKCLTKAAINKRTQQATIFQFAARTVTREPQQQQQQQQQQQRCDAARVRGSAASAALAAGAAAAASRILGAAGEREGAAEEIDLTWSSDEGDAIPHQSALKGGWRPAAAGKIGAQRGESPPAPSAAATLPEECRRTGKQREQRREASPSVSWPSQSTPSSQEQPPVHSARRPSPAPSPPVSTTAPTAATASPVGAPASPAVTPARRQQQATLQRPSGGPPPPSLLRRFQCSVVGRHFQKHEVDCRSGQRLAVECEEDNPRDANALLALDTHSRVAVGHLPHAVARQLAPLLRHGRAVAEAVVQEEPLGEREPVLVELQVTLVPAAPGASPGAARRTAAALDRAEAAAAAQLAAAPRATGERLHANFLSLLDTVQQHDGHLLAEPETALIQAYKALSLPAQCLFLRLFQRKGPLFSLSSLAYKEVPDAAAAACQLATAGLAVVLEPASGGGSGQDGCQAGSGGDAQAGDGAGSGQPGERAQGGGGAGGQAVGATATWTDLAELLTVPDLVAVTAARGLRVAAPQRNRAALLSALEAHAAGSAAAAAQAAAWLLEATGAVLRLAQGAREAVARLQRFFFLNEGQSLSQFLASDLGVMQYPPYAVHRSGSAFSSRQQLLAYEAALGHAAQLAEASENGDVAAAEAALQHAWVALDADMHKQARPEGHPFLSQFHAGWVYCQMASYGVHQLERQKRYQEAVQRLESLLDGCCCPGRRGEWWERLSINLKHLGRHEQALQRAEAALDDPWLSCGERLALQRRVLFLGKPPWRWKPPPWKAAALREPPELRITARPLNRTVGAKSRFYGLDDEQVGVEALALQYYASQEGGGWRGVHSEGGVWATLFGLLLWDALFMPVPDVFRTPFQTAPLDLNSPSFYPTRKEAVEGCLQRIAAGEAPRLLRLAWEQHRGVMCRGVSWDRHTLEELQQVAECVGGRGLAAVLRLLATDHAGWSGGMPDLLLWRPAKRDAKLAEVKGPRDRLSSQQTAWMHALNDAGLRAEVLKVVEPSQAGKRARRR